MSGWRSKLIFLLIVYFAGFATAIYTLGPTPKSDGHASFSGQATLNGFIRDSEGNSRMTRKDFVNSFNAGMHKCVDFGKEATTRTAKFVKKKIKKMRDA